MLPLEFFQSGGHTLACSPIVSNTAPARWGLGILFWGHLNLVGLAQVSSAALLLEEGGAKCLFLNLKILLF